MTLSQTDQKTLKDSHMKVHTSDVTAWQIFSMTPSDSDWQKVKVTKIKNLRY